jgi:hypothetical protein
MGCKAGLMAGTRKMMDGLLEGASGEILRRTDLGKYLQLLYSYGWPIQV